MIEVRLDDRGPAAPPRTNGELVFEAPWEGRVFGMVMALCERGIVEWPVFRQHLISTIAAWETEPPPKPEWNYYTCWLGALEQTLGESDLLDSATLETLFAQYNARPHGHDHK